MMTSYIKDPNFSLKMWKSVFDDMLLISIKAKDDTIFFHREAPY